MTADTGDTRRADLAGASITFDGRPDDTVLDGRWAITAEQASMGELALDADVVQLQDGVMNEIELLADSDRRAAAYLASLAGRRVFPDARAVDALSAFAAPMADGSRDPAQVLALLDEVGSPATVASNGSRYFGFVVGATLPVAAAADRLVSAWDQCASSSLNSPAAAAVERAAGRLVLQALDLPAEAAVGFGTSATACALACLSAGRRQLLSRAGWDVERDGVAGAPEVRVVVPETVHITVLKALRVLGFGTAGILRAPCDEHGRIDPSQLPELDARTLLVLQAGEVNTGEFDLFEPLVERAHEAGAWVHVDGAFGLWARASRDARYLTAGVDGADSWTTDGHKWLNTPYDGAMAICRDAGALSEAMNADAAYAVAEPDAQKNLILEFSRRARGVPVWAALTALGRDGLNDLVERHRGYARMLADGARAAGLDVLNRVVLNQVLVRAGDDARTLAVARAVQERGQVWFGTTRWQGRAAIRLSVSSWRTSEEDVKCLLDELRTVSQRNPSAGTR